MSILLPPSATRDEVEELRAPPHRPRPRAPLVSRPGHAPAMAAHGTATGARAVACVLGGRWLLECPFCPALRHKPFLNPGLDGLGRPLGAFRCGLCKNSAAGGRVVETVWPSPNDRRAIEEVLRLRPTEYRAWLPRDGETIDTLRAENVEHGLPPGA